MIVNIKKDYSNNYNYIANNYNYLGNKYGHYVIFGITIVLVAIRSTSKFENKT